MLNSKQTHKIVRYFKVFKRKLKRFIRRAKNLTVGEAGLWLKANLKQHPFILGFLLLIWINQSFITEFFAKDNIRGALKFHLFILILWLGSVILSNLLKDKDKSKVKWYLRKRFVFFMLLVFPPLGLIFLWSGSQFKRITKIIFTIVFGCLFVINNINYHKKYEKLLSKSAIEKTIEMITQQKKKTFLAKLNKDVLTGFKLAKIPKNFRVKLAVSNIAARCSPGVVSIKTKDKYGKDIGMGSGFIISQNGLIVTNFHVISSAYQAQIKLGEGILKGAYLVKAVPDFDIAILKIDANYLAALPIGDSDSLVSGEFIVTLGNPWGFEHSVSTGIVSAVRAKDEMKLIQMTAPVSPGSSGGPILNEYGEVVGITTLASFFLAQNLNFAIPINYLNEVIKEK